MVICLAASMPDEMRQIIWPTHLGNVNIYILSSGTSVAQMSLYLYRIYWRPKCHNTSRALRGRISHSLLIHICTDLSLHGLEVVGLLDLSLPLLP